MLKIISFKFSWLFLGIIAALLLYNIYYDIRGQIYLMSPITNIYEQAIIVPDFKVGEDPILSYTRNNHENFITIYNASVRNAITDQTICRRSGSATFKKDEPLPTKGITFEVYMSYNCLSSVVPGQYYIEVSNIIKKEGFPDRIYTIRSNLFKISAA